jgi:hypothetical protein
MTPTQASHRTTVMGFAALFRFTTMTILNEARRTMPLLLVLEHRNPSV